MKYYGITRVAAMLVKDLEKNGFEVLTVLIGLRGGDVTVFVFSEPELSGWATEHGYDVTEDAEANADETIRKRTVTVEEDVFVSQIIK